MRPLICLSFVLPFFAYGQPKITYDNGVFRLSPEPQIVSNAGASRQAGWSYFWEFGDGYYCYVPYGAKDKSVRHLYQEPGVYPARVYLTPLYSHQSHPPPFEHLVTVQQGSGQIPARCPIANVLEKDQLVGITSNANGELVPGGEIQVAVHFRAPANAPGPVNGTLLLGFNDPAELKKYGLKFPPLLFSKNHPSNKRDRLHQAEWAENSAATGNHVGYLGRGDHLVLKYNNLKPNEERWLFLTFQANRTLDSTILKKSKRELRTTLSAVWLPGTATARNNTCKYTFTLLPVHDPNRTSVVPETAYYKRQDPSNLEYLVQFQNEEPGTVHEIDVQVPVYPSIDPGKIQIIGTQPPCAICPENFNPERDTQSCIRIDSALSADKTFLHLRFHNVFLPGDGPERLSKGWVRFTARTTEAREAFTPMRAAIQFDRANYIFTNRVKTYWRYRTAGVSAGLLAWASFKDHEYAPENALDRLTFGLWWQDAPLKTGYGYGFGIQYTPFRFSQRLATNWFADGIAFGGELIEDAPRIRCLDLVVTGRGNYRGIVSGGLGAGLSLPLWAEARRTIRYYDDDFLLTNTGSTFDGLKEEFTDEMIFDLLEAYPAVYEAKQTTRFGWLQKNKTEPAPFFPEDLSSSRSIGVMASAFVEFGLIGDLSLGYRQDIRFYPKFYRDENVTVLNGEVFLRCKLLTLKP